MMKHKLFKLLVASCSLFCLVGIVSATITWFNPKATINSENDEISASTMGNYFAYGNGKPTSEETGDKVYGISKPRHLYNLAWLQYLGFFKDEHGNPTQPYFELANDIDMTGWVLPPIGTIEHPFIGNFEGNNHKISGLTVSNKLSAYNTFPYDVENDFSEPEIVGFFGVVGQYEDNTISYSSAINVITNTIFSDITVKTETAHSLIGIVAGYVNGTLDKVAVNNSRTYVKDNTVRHLGNFGNISNYTIVGYCTNGYKESLTKLTDASYQVVVDPNKYSFPAKTQGSDNDWGGSINMKDMYNRIKNVSTTVSDSTIESKRTVYHNENGTTTYNHNESTIANFRRNHTRAASGNYSYMLNIPGSGYGYYYLQGGVYQKDITYDYASHTGKTISKGSHFLRVSNFTETGGTLGDGVDGNATLWTIPNESGYIYTSYYYNKNNGPVDYYLYNNNGTLQLSTTNKTTWVRDAAVDGSVRYYASGTKYYLDFDSTWKMRNYATENTEPVVPAEPKTYAQGVADGTYEANTYQIYTTSGTTKYFLSYNRNNTTLSASTDISIGWKISSLSSSTYISVPFKINNKNYSLNGENGSAYTLADDSSWFSGPDSFSFNKTSGSLYKISYSGGIFSSTYYMTFSNGKFVSTTSSSATVNLETTEAYVNREYESLKQKYDQKVEEHESWESAWNAIHNLDAAIEYTRTGTDVYKSKDTGYKMVYTADETTYFPLNVKKDGAEGSFANGDYDAFKTNTGYVVAGSDLDFTTTDTGKSRIRISEYPIDGKYSVKESYVASDGEIKPNKVYTITMDGQTKTMDEIPADNKKKFEDTRDSLYKNAFKDSTSVFGMHFMGSQISINNVVNATNVNILGTNYPTYQMPVNSIDFNLKQKGSINFMAGSYFNNNDPVVNFFTLHKVYRSGTNISEIKEILEIYSDGAPNHSYIYKFRDGTYSTPYRIGAGNKRYEMNEDDDSTDLYTERCMPYEAEHEGDEDFKSLYEETYSKVFDTNSIANYNSNTSNTTGIKINQNALYYFEIPMNDGEFCLGSAPSGAGGYLLYLDIGANATNYERTIAYEHISHSTDTYNYPKGVSFTNSSTTVNAKDSACMTIKDGYSGNFEVNRNVNTDTFTITTTDWTTSKLGYYKESIAGINTAVAYNDSTDFTENTEAATSNFTDTRRMEYIDHNVNLNEYTKTIIADTKTNGEGNYVRDYVEQRYQDGSKVPTDEIEIFTNDGSRISNDQGGKYASTIVLPTEEHAGDLYSNTVLGILRVELDNSQTATIDWDLELAVDDNVDKQGTYYKFKDYKVTYTVAGNPITVIVRKWDQRAKDLYIGTTEVTAIRQTVPVAVTPVQN